MGFPLLTAGALNSIFFGVYGNCLRALENCCKRHDPGNSDISKYWYTNVFMAGVGAGIVQVAFATPIELVKIQLQSQTGTWEKQHIRKHVGPINCILHIVNEHGLRGLYHGSHIMLYRDSLSSGLYVLTYAVCLDLLHGPQHVWTVIFAGGIAGVISWASIMPLDVIKSRIQADDLANPEYKGIVDCTIKSFRKDGLHVFGRGFVMCSFRSFLVNAATFLGYEWSLRFCQDMSKDFPTHQELKDIRQTN
ncbi:solute carrier family 25 member 45-like isoform X3 [Zootermopsis nevadensis]|nr:solute carrier family 25 member 45-like isoform X3 [Zootermopsis nevadensis]